MTRRNHTAELQQFLDDLTPEQRDQIANATAQDWIDAIGVCIKDPGFWQRVGTAFLEGAINGVNDYLNRR